MPAPLLGRLLIFPDLVLVQSQSHVMTQINFCFDFAAQEDSAKFRTAYLFSITRSREPLSFNVVTEDGGFQDRCSQQTVLHVDSIRDSYLIKVATKGFGTTWKIARTTKVCGSRTRHCTPLVGLWVGNNEEASLTYLCVPLTHGVDSALTSEADVEVHPTGKWTIRSSVAFRKSQSTAPESHRATPHFQSACGVVPLRIFHEATVPRVSETGG